MAPKTRVPDSLTRVTLMRADLDQQALLHPCLVTAPIQLRR